MSDAVLIALIAAGGLLASVVAWKVLDIGKRAVELGDTRSSDTRSGNARSGNARSEDR